MMRLFIAAALAAAISNVGAQIPPVPPAPPTPLPTPRAVPPAPPAQPGLPIPTPRPPLPPDPLDRELALRELEWQLRDRALERTWDAELRAQELRWEMERRALDLEHRAFELNQRGWDREFRVAQEAMARGLEWAQVTPAPMPPLAPPTPLPPSWEVEFARAQQGIAPAAVRPWPPAGESFSPIRESWLPQDPADSLYTSARLMYNRSQYRAAAESFRSLRQRFPSSGYVADAMYYEARALYQIGGQYELQTARDLLNERKQKFPNAPIHDAGFETRVMGALADRGDRTARAAITQAATGRGTAGAAQGVRGAQNASAQDPSCDRNAIAIRIEALNALSRMQVDSTIPIIRRVLANRDSCSERLRMQAIMLLTKSIDAATTDILVDVIKNDPSIDVKRHAVSWLGEVPSDRGIAALEEILRSPQDAVLHSDALRAIGNTRSPRATQVIRSTIERADAADEVRRSAISALARADSAGAGAYLRGIYPRLAGNRLKEAALTTIARLPGEENRRWLTEFVRNPAEPVALRQSVLRALTSARDTPMATITALYSAVPELELKTQIISSMGGRREPEVVDELIKMYRATTDTKLQLQIVNSLARRDDPKAKQFLMDILK